MTDSCKLYFKTMNHIELPVEKLSAQYTVQPKPEIKKPISDLKDSANTIIKDQPSPPSKYISSNPLTIGSLNQSFANYFPRALHLP